MYLSISGFMNINFFDYYLCFCFIAVQVKTCKMTMKKQIIEMSEARLLTKQNLKGRGHLSTFKSDSLTLKINTVFLGQVQ